MKKKSCREVKSGAPEGKRHRQAGPYQLADDFLEKLSTFLHLVLRPSQLHDVALLRRVGEIDNDLEGGGIVVYTFVLNYINTGLRR